MEKTVHTAMMDSGALVPLMCELLFLRLRPGFLRIYLVGSAMALLGVVVGVAEMLRLTFCPYHASVGPDEEYEELLDTLREITHTHRDLMASMDPKEERQSFKNWKPLDNEPRVKSNGALLNVRT